MRKRKQGVREPHDTSHIFLGEDASRVDKEGPLSAQGLRGQALENIILGDFRIIKKLGVGTMGAVYLAHQISRNRRVALKVLSPELVERPPLVERFYREASMMANLRHPNLVRCLAVGRDQKIPYLAMEYVDGVSLSIVLRRLGGKMRIRDAVYVALKCAEALEHAHEHQIVHRDIKPSNILITRLGELKIADMGLAKPLDISLSLTDSGIGMGTPQYMAPEQARDAKHADHRSDIYALGSMFYRLLTGALPFAGKAGVELVLSKEQGLFLPASRLNDKITPQLDDVLGKMLGATPAQRYQSYGDLIADLKQLKLAKSRLSFKLVRSDEEFPWYAEPPDIKLTVLFIHDNDIEALLARTAFEKSGIPNNFCVANFGKDALVHLRQESPQGEASRPHLILLGYPLPGEGGPEVLAELQTSEWLREVPVVVLAASREAKKVLKKQGFRASSYLTKPKDLKAFERLVENVYALFLTTLEMPPAST